MTKKDFKKFAEMVARLEKEAGRNSLIHIGKVENEITKILEEDNPRFSWAKWNDYKDKFSE